MRGGPIEAVCGLTTLYLKAGRSRNRSVSRTSAGRALLRIVRPVAPSYWAENTSGGR
jgi:hypothetical protein